VYDVLVPVKCGCHCLLNDFQVGILPQSGWLQQLWLSSQYCCCYEGGKEPHIIIIISVIVCSVGLLIGVEGTRAG